jgi:hypothetical protein
MLHLLLSLLQFPLTTGEPGLRYGDFDADGRTDLVVADGQGLWLYRNTGSGGFVDATEGSGLRGEAQSAEVLDVDLDGALDLFVLRRGGEPALYRGLGRGIF